MTSAVGLLLRVRTTLASAFARGLSTTGATATLSHDEILAAAWSVERPKRAEHGDLATNLALVLAKRVGLPPRAIAEAVVKGLADDALVASADIAGPGFLNLRLHPVAFHDELRAIARAGAAYGRAPAATGERIHLEFVSANPTGPINVASGRNAIFGDTVGRLLEAVGHRVTREYYINDFGNQIRLFAGSVRATSKGHDVGEDGYRGSYVGELARWIQANEPELLKDGSDESELARVCITLMLGGIPGSQDLPGIRRSLADIGVFFDSWFSEESLHRWGKVRAVLLKLAASGHLVDKDGATFFVVAAGEGSEDKERVVRKSDGSYTYFASDIAYHEDKLSRGYDRLINVLGADHHGYVARVTNALEALGLPSGRFEALLYQLVYIYKDGELVKSSKRAGNFVTVEEICEEIDAAAGRPGAGRDALRFFFLSRSATTNVELDIELAKKSSLDNPVFYVQYGHARLCSILRKADEIGLGDLARTADLSALVHPDELALVMRLAEFPALVADAAASREPHKVTFYVQTLAREFQSYFTRLKVDPILPPASVRAEEGWPSRWDLGKTAARLAWIDGVRTVYRTALTMLGVSAPERMDLPRTAGAASDPEGSHDEDEA